ncbi:hypothetical protein KVV02_004009 [Mortierella alpina]|uniref:Transmembrane protein n=1 Tax=Mortierella alpina TaxID=64518 RepID=A0A9P8CX93_MORAP|nr:hypothetical protein KVV02_004009 [Mortierella alpina]
MNQDLSPFCFTSDGTSIYAAAYEYDWEGATTTSTSQGRRIAKILVVRSNPYPASLETLTWSLMAVASIPSWQPTPNPNTLVHTCAIHPDTALFGISAQAINGSVASSTGYNMEISTMFSPVVSLSKLRYGQSLLLPRGDFDGPWLKIHLDQRVNEMILNITGTRGARGGLLAHLSNTLYILQSMGTGPLLSTIILDPSTPPPSAMHSVAQTANTTLDEDCDLNNDQTAMATDKRTLYLFCREQPQPGLSDRHMFKMYMLNGSVFQQLATFPANTLQNMQEPGQQEHNASFQMVPVPSQSGSASWIYLYHSNGHAYSIDPHGDNSGYLMKNTTLRVAQHVSSDSEQSGERKDAMGDPWVKAFLYLAFAGILILLCLCAIRHHKQKPKQPRRLNPGHHPTLPIQLQATPMPDSVPETYRVPTGEDACDTLPYYTPRDTDPPAQLLPQPPVYTDPLPKYTEPSSSLAFGGGTGGSGSSRVP